MGYETKFTLTYDSDEITDKQVLDALAEINHEYFDFGFEDLDDTFCEPMKWYNHGNNMETLSMVFPDTLFILEGWGEEEGDIWREYYYNGKSQIAPGKVVFPEPYWDYLKEDRNERQYP